MTYPQPDPHPSGPVGPTIADLLAYARANGWDHTCWGAWHNKQHIFQCGRWRIEVEVWPEGHVLSLYERAGSVCGLLAVTTVRSPEEAVDWLRWRGVLPAVEGAAA